MKAKSTDVRVLGIVLVAALAGSGTLQADNNNPSFEACTRYAEADHAAEAAVQEAKTAFEAAVQQAAAAQKAVKQQADAVLKAVEQEAEQASADLRDAALQAKADYEDAVQPAKEARDAAYIAIHDDDGGARSDVPAVMEKLRKHHRLLCRVRHGL